MSGDVLVRRIFGPPGTGKTRTLANRVQSTVAERGADAIAIVSFSVTAAEEIASRPGVKDILPGSAVGTLHSRALHAIDRPPLALDPEVLADWNASVGPTWQITGQTRGPRGLESADRAGAGGAENGDGLLEAMELYRARMVPTVDWDSPVRAFARRWQDWKRKVGAADFTDLVVGAYRRAANGEPMPGNPAVLVVDEAQDLTPIEAELTLMWGRNLRTDSGGGRLVYALDDDQAIAKWRGGDPRTILGLDDAVDEPLRKSWRVPPAVHAVANTWIERVSERYPKPYEPRDPNPALDPTPAHSRGWAYRVGFGLNDSDLVDSIEADLSDPDDPNADVMVIATCGYMLHPLIAELRRRGIPFHNPYRPSEQSWNPLRKPDRGMSTVERIWRYLVIADSLGERGRLWTGEDVAAWLPMLDVREAGLVRGAKSTLDQLPPGTVPYELVAGLFREDAAGDEALTRASVADVEWLAHCLLDSRRKAAAYPLQVVRSSGPAALVDRPRVVVGTIHSTKGAQSSRVYVAPDLSGAGARQWEQSLEGRDEIVRVLYVALTRAFHSVRVLQGSSPNAVDVAELLPVGLEVRP